MKRAGLRVFEHPSIERREGQMRMAETIADLFDAPRVTGRGEHLVVSAPTGTGKTFGYLIPAVFADAPVTVSTATKSLQAQIIERDANLLRDAEVPVELSGRFGVSNYVCLRDFAGSAQSLPLPVRAAVRDSPTGLRSDVEQRLQGFEADRSAQEPSRGGAALLTGALPDDTWHLISTTHTECAGHLCPYAEDCHVYREQRRVQVTNHALTALDLLGFSAEKPRTLVIDEAHEFVSTFAQTMTSEIALTGVFQAAKVLEIVGTSEDRKLIGSLAEELKTAVSAHEEARFSEDVVPLATPGAHQRIARGISQLAQLAERIASSEDILLTERQAVTVATLTRLRAPTWSAGWYLHTWRNPKQDAEQMVTIRPGPSIVSSTLKAALQPVNVIAVTAVIPADELATELGLNTRRPSRLPAVLSVPDPLKAAWRRSALYVTADLPEPSADGWRTEVCDRIEKLTSLAEGRTLILCTSWVMVRNVTTHLRNAAAENNWGFPIYSQWKSRTAETDFREDVPSCLVATASFWQGADFAGETCRQVILDKLPFPSPGRIDLAGAIFEADDGFRDVSLPLARQRLRQGIGRLVRRADDYGVVAVCDARLASRTYGKFLMRGLPDMRKFRNLSSVRDYWRTRTRHA